MNRCGFLGGKEAIISLRSSGYKDTSRAIGELIDNSIQAQASEVTIVLRIESGKATSRTTKHVADIAVIDNGRGMDSETLQKSLVLGEGLNRLDERGIGKYGVGLPQSSISQAKRVDVWSWQNGSEAKHVYIDLNDDLWLNDAEIKEPDSKGIPDDYSQFITSECGTIVQWSDVDRISWKKAATVFQKCENRIGRMYRYWLNDESLKLRMVSIDRNGRIIGGQDNYFKAVDPLFLMENAKYENSPIKPMFKLFRQPYHLKYEVETEGGRKNVEVVVTFSIVKEEVRNNDDDSVAGSTPYGKLAKECIGVSIVREGRELELSDSWYCPDIKDPRHRWWGAEIRFDSSLDEVFGVTNNKQSATRLTELAMKNLDDLDDEFGLDHTNDDACKRLKDEDPNSYMLFDLITRVHDGIKKMSSEVERQNRKRKSEKATRHDSERKVQARYDDLVKKRSENDQTRSETDNLLQQRGDNRIEGVEESISQNGSYSETDREKIRDDVILDHRCSIVVAPADSSSFFNIKNEDTQMIVLLNSQHPMYEQLFGKFNSMLVGNEDAESMKIQVRDAFDTVQFLLAAWARMEDEARDSKVRTQYRQIRERWGQLLEESFLDDQ